MLCDMDECLYRLEDTPKTFEKYPFRFSLEAGYRLEGRSIEVSWRVENRGSEAMYFMIGGHPAFRVPEGKNIYDYTLVFNQKRGRAETAWMPLATRHPTGKDSGRRRLPARLLWRRVRFPLLRDFLTER